MTTPMTPLEMERLAFVKFLFDQGQAQARQPEPLNATAVLSFHDAVEQFLRLAADHLGVSLSKNVTFLGYWSEIKSGSTANITLPSKAPMDRMNSLRVGFKHHGTIPSKSAIEQSRADSVTFFTDAVPMVFGVGFEGIDMIDLVTQPETAKILRHTQAQADAGQWPSAMAGLMIAFTGLVNHYGEYHTYDRSHPFRFGPTIGPLATSMDPVTTALRPLFQAVGSMQTAMRIMALGIDYSQYAKFEVICPKVSQIYSENGTRYTFHLTEAQRQALGVTEYESGRHFVIEAAIQAARAESALQARSDHQAINSPAPGVWHSGTAHEWKAPEEA
ncbi:hypothetical protein GXW83_27310 [Streptacidiphilus sp. PB12-B1b]|uniref:hypothetical protein n=1 Tax=Streptacidiphilus sp. PB12-B1b TaxID=2705012 RepID=UPI0015FE5DE2|nr:hypothetical protein [Streptacidiphilus sp. PB12-B1b]QMU78856.1 hypothetical protein GXW83_27310 [Streptacidiphilus sp. PB12-B1b]